MKKKQSTILLFVETLYGALTPDKKAQADKTQQAYKSFRARSLSQRSYFEIIADTITSAFGSITVLIIHLVIFVGWLLINTGKIPGVAIIDPYPFGLMTTIVSLEAIFLSLFVLMSQSRESQVNDLREEVDFQITMQAEQEVTKLIHMVHEIHEHLGLAGKKDKELESMKQRLDTDKLEAQILEEVNKA